MRLALSVLLPPKRHGASKDWRPMAGGWGETCCREKKTSGCGGKEGNKFGTASDWRRGRLAWTRRDGTRGLPASDWPRPGRPAEIGKSRYRHLDSFLASFLFAVHGGVGWMEGSCLVFGMEASLVSGSE